MLHNYRQCNYLNTLKTKFRSFKTCLIKNKKHVFNVSSLSLHSYLLFRLSDLKYDRTFILM